MKKRVFSIVLLLLMLVLFTMPVLAQSYYFQVDRAEVNVYIQSDGSAAISYNLDFINQPGAHEIDFIDIGTPNYNFNESDIYAEIDGTPLYYISKDEYQGSGSGFAVGLQENAIPAGSSGKVNIQINQLTNLLYRADEPENYASFNFSPTYFDGQYVTGKTDYTVTLFFPEGIDPESPRYFTPQGWPGTSEPESGYDEQGRVFYRWHSADADVATQYVFGGGFPEEMVPAGTLSTKPLFNINFGQLFEVLCPLAVCVGVFGFPIIGGILGYRNSQKRKMKYLPPKITIEGHGIKRGLTAIEAAILMEQPADKIFTMILFSVIKKGAASVTSRDPLKLELHTVEPKSLKTYEIEFLKAFETTNKNKQRKAMQTILVNLIKSVSEKMKGFSHKETVAYYKEIMQKAWTQVQEADTPDVKMQKFDDNMDWTMLDGDFDRRMDDVFRTGPVFVPVWWGHFDPTFHSPTSNVPSSSSGNQSGGTPISMPNLPGSAFAASMIGGIQDFSSNVIGNVTSFTNGVTKVTNPPPPPSSGSNFRGGSGGGGGCACACACAGCACACAGGGR